MLTDSNTDLVTPSSATKLPSGSSPGTEDVLLPLSKPNSAQANKDSRTNFPVPTAPTSIYTAAPPTAHRTTSVLRVPQPDPSPPSSSPFPYTVATSSCDGGSPPQRHFKTSSSFPPPVSSTFSSLPPASHHLHGPHSPSSFSSSLSSSSALPSIHAVSHEGFEKDPSKYEDGEDKSVIEPDHQFGRARLAERPCDVSDPNRLPHARLSSNSEQNHQPNPHSHPSETRSSSQSRLLPDHISETFLGNESVCETETDVESHDCVVVDVVPINGTLRSKAIEEERTKACNEDFDEGYDEEDDEVEKESVEEVMLAYGQIQPHFQHIPDLPVNESIFVPSAQDFVPDADQFRPPPPRTGYVFDYRMTAHAPLPGTLDAHDHPESYMRLVSMYTRLMDEGILDQCLHIDSKEVDRDLVLRVHTREYCEWVEKVEALSHKDLLGLNQLLARESVYMNNKSAMCARLAAGSTVELCRAVVEGRVRNGFAIVRPPGHHAEHNKAMGFCVYNNVAIAVRDLQQQFGLKKILIVDWDVHHGNGIQNTFEGDSSVMYISIHRYENASFYPESVAAAGDFIGVDDGSGFNINIAWPCAGMGDPEYLHAFHKLVMPVAYEFQPEMVIVAAGFDAAEGDPIGGCHVSPSGFATMTHQLKGLADGNLVLALEGGYDITAICDSVSACTKVLLGDSPPTPRCDRPVRPEAAQAVQETIVALSGYWSVLSPMGGRLNKPAKSYDRTFSLADVMRGHRARYLFREYEMIGIPLKERSRLGVFDNDVFVTNNFCTAQTLFLSVHDIWPIRIEFDENSDIDMHGSFGADPMHLILNTIKESGHGLIDVCISQKETRDMRTLKRELLEHVWDEYISPAGCTRIVVLCTGSACAEMVKFLSRRSVEDQVLCIVMVPGDTEEIPKISSGKAQWYFDNSYIMAPTNHDRGNQRVENKREGRVIHQDRPSKTKDDRTQDIMHHHIFSFISDRIQTASEPRSSFPNNPIPIPPSPTTPTASFHLFGFDEPPFPLHDMRRCSSTSSTSSISTPIDLRPRSSMPFAED